MDYRKFGDCYLVRIDRGEEVIESLTNMCKTEDITLATVSGLGAMDYAKIGLYKVANHNYESYEFNGEQEASSIVGTITEKDGAPYLHLHITLSGKGMTIHGGHLNSCRVSGTCELAVTVLNGHVGRKLDNKTGLNIYDFT